MGRLPLSLDLVILAGGRGKRLGGRLKPLLDARGETLLARALRTWPGRRVHVVAPEKSHRAALAEHLPEARVCFVSDPGEGPARAVVVSARVSDARWLLVVAADHPAPDRALGERLARAAEGGEGAAVRDAEGRLQPLPSVLERTRLLAQPRTHRLATLIQGLSLIEVPWAELGPDERGALVDVDTAADAHALGIDPDSAPRLRPSEAEPSS